MVNWKMEVKKLSRRQSTEVKRGCGGMREPNASEFWRREESGSENFHNGR